MYARRFHTAALGAAVALVPALAGAQRFEYAPGTSQYRIVTTGTGFAEQMGQRQDVNFDTQQRLTLTLARHAKDSLDLTMTLDSLTGRAPNGMPIDPGVASGLKVTGVISPSGRVYTRQIPENPAQAALRQAAEEMARFLPFVPGTVKAGTTWTDTNATPVKQMGMEISRTVITTYKVVGDTMVDGEKSWRIERAATTTLSGSGSAMGQPLTIEGSAVGSGMIFVSPKGLYLGGELKDEVKSKVTLVAQGMDVNSSQTQVTKISRVKP